MNFGEMKAAVLAFVKRTQTSFNIGGQDILSLAVNQARLYSERLYDFEHSRVAAKVDVPPDGVDITAATLTNGSPVSLKTIKAALVSDEENRLVPIRTISRADHHVVSLLSGGPSQLSLAQFGTTLYLTPRPANTVTVFLDAIRWLKPYVEDTDTDFLLTYCHDYMLFRTIEMLNFFLKEDARIPISRGLLDAAWKSVRVWDSNILSGTTSTFLD